MKWLIPRMKDEWKHFIYVVINRLKDQERTTIKQKEHNENFVETSRFNFGAHGPILHH